MVKVTMTDALVLLMSVPLILPDPLAGMPVTGLVWSRVQLYVVPVTFPLSWIADRAVPLHTDWEDGFATTLGMGLTTTTVVIACP